MKAIVFDRYGPPAVLRLAEVERPTPKAEEVLIKVCATTVNRTDCAYRSGADFITRLGYSITTTGGLQAFRRPVKRILGMELAGEVAAVGAAVTTFAVGDPVFGVNPGGFGANAEYICMPERAPLALKPANLTFEEAAAVGDGGILALGCLRKANLQKGQRILVYGASGSIGTAGVQLAKALGAHVTAVCNTKNVEIVRRLGPDAVIDYLNEDFTRNGETYDVIFDAVGKHSFRRCRGSLAPGGTYLPTDGWENAAWIFLTPLVGSKRVVVDIPPQYTREKILFLKDLVQAGQYRPVIDRCYPLEQAVEASQYVETGQKAGNVVLTVRG